jgi:hypothetical protein
MASGFVIERIGYPLTISLSAALGLVFTILIGLRWRASIWSRRGHPTRRWPGACRADEGRPGRLAGPGRAFYSRDGVAMGGPVASIGGEPNGGKQCSTGE